MHQNATRIGWTTVLLTVLLSGCGLAPNYNLGASEDAKIGVQAAVVMSATANSVDPQSIGRGLQGLTVSWQEYGPTTGRILEEGKSFHYVRKLSTPVMSILSSSAPPRTADEPEHQVFLLKPGHYVAVKVVAWQPRGTGSAVQVEHPLMPANDKIFQGQVYDKNATASASIGPRFSVRAGEAVYIGNFELGSLGHRSRAVSVSRHGALARAALRKHSNLPQDIQYREPEFGG